MPTISMFYGIIVRMFCAPSEVVGGLASSTLLTPFVLAILYRVFSRGVQVQNAMEG